MSQELCKITNGCPEYTSFVISVSSYCYSLSYKYECFAPKNWVNLFFCFLTFAVILFYFFIFLSFFVLTIIFVTSFSSVTSLNHLIFVIAFYNKKNHNIYCITNFLLVSSGTMELFMILNKCWNKPVLRLTTLFPLKI